MKGRSTRKTGGTVVKDAPVTTAYAGGGSNVAKEAAKRKRGGKAMEKMAGMKAKMNMGRKPRKSGGKVLGGTEWASAQGEGSKPAGRVTDGSV